MHTFKLAKACPFRVKNQCVSYVTVTSTLILQVSTSLRTPRKATNMCMVSEEVRAVLHTKIDHATSVSGKCHTVAVAGFMAYSH